MEDPRNIIIYQTCPKHSSHPQSKYASWDPATFVGKWVKTEFTENLTGRKEHLWVKILEVTQNGKALLGTIDNDPLLNLGVECGDTTEVLVSSIESCFDGKNVL